MSLAHADLPGDHPTGALSPSRAADFMSCPLKYRFRVIDRLPEAPSPVAVRGTVVHAVLERLFDLPAGQRTLERAVEMVEPQWQRLLDAEPELAQLFAEDSSGDELAAWLTEAHELLGRYFTLEDPNALEPAERELYVEAELDRKSTRLNSSHVKISYAVFCLKKKKKMTAQPLLQHQTLTPPVQQN